MASSPETIRLGAAQLAEVYLDTDATIEKDCEYVRRAGERDVDLLVFPEFHIARPTWYRHDERAQERSFPEYYRRLFEAAVTVPGPEIDRIREAAADAGTAVVLGVTEKRPETAGTMYNSQVFVDADGTLLGVRRKLVPTLHERLFHASGGGRDVRVFECAFGTVGGMMCGEHTNHLLGFSLLALGEDVHAASWPSFHWLDREEREEKVGLRTRFHAYTGKVPTVLATGTVTDDLAAEIGGDISTDAGASAVIGPDGRYLAGPKWDGEGLVTAEVDVADRIEGKALHDVVGHYNRFDVFDLTVHVDDRQPVTVADRTAPADAEAEDSPGRATPITGPPPASPVPDSETDERYLRRALASIRAHAEGNDEALSHLERLADSLA